MAITAKAEEIRKIIEAAGGEWVNRRQLAQALGKNKLTQWNLKLLDDLIAAGLIESEQREQPKRFSAVGYEHVYRVAPLFVVWGLMGDGDGVYIDLTDHTDSAAMASFNEIASSEPVIKAHAAGRIINIALLTPTERYTEDDVRQQVIQWLIDQGHLTDT